MFASFSPLPVETEPRSIGAVKVLRISVTDRCNFRCMYCMPETGVKWLARQDILTYEEVADVVRAAVDLHGIHRFKLTGGEPTVRHNIVELVRILRRINGVDDLSLTTNGLLMEDLAQPFRESGLDRVTISLDSLQSEKFRRITRTGDLSAVLRGLDRCEAVSFKSLKINCVTMRGTNSDELADFARLTLRRRLTVRFIEYMPLGDAAVMYTLPGSRISNDELGSAAGCGSQDRGQNTFITESEVRQKIEQELGPLIPVDRDSEPGVGPAIPWVLSRGNPLGRVGFISAMSAPFCDTCNRLRLTANGVLRSCLFDGGEVAIRDLMRGKANPAERYSALARAMTACVRLKPTMHSGHGNQQMSQIGG